MPRGTDYPHDQSAKYPLQTRSQIRTFPAANNIQGIILNTEGDVRTWVISAGVQASHRDLITALAYLDVADRVAEEHEAQEAQRYAEIKSEVVQLRQGIEQLRDAVENNTKQVQAIVNFLGVMVPAWHNREEIEQGDDMGMLIQSAESLGLVVEIIPLQLEPGFAHEEVVSMEPPAGTIVARGSTVRVNMNFMG